MIFVRNGNVKKIILASASPRRKALLTQAGLTPDRIIPADVDENIDEKDPETFVKKLSLLKAENIVAKCNENAIIIGSDTVVTLDGEILGKPKDRACAAKMIKKISGRSHDVYTAVTLISKNSEIEKTVTFAEKTEVFLYEISDDEIREYIETGDSDDKAGAYGIQGDFARFVKGIKGDYNSVIGLPIGRVYQEIKKLT